MEPVEIIGLLATINGLIIDGQKLAITLGGKELTNEELAARIDAIKIQIAYNRDN